MMSSWREILFRLRETFRSRRHNDEMDEEMRHHLELRIERNVANGMSPEEARYAAVRSFGGMEQIKERARDERTARWLEDLLRNLRLAGRTLRKHPVYAFTVIATLGLCLAANLAIYSAVDAVVLRPLPFPAPDRLVSILNSYPGAGYPRGGSSITNYFERRHALPALQSVSMITEGDAVIGAAGSPERVPVAWVTPEFFTTLGVPLVSGRFFAEDELNYGATQVAIITDDFWRGQFHGDPSVLGKTFLSDDTPVTVVGVLPPGFRYLSSRARFFRPLAHDPASRGPQKRHASTGQMIARLAVGATIREAQAQLDAINARELSDPADPMSSSLKGWGYHTLVLPLHADFVASVRPALLLLQAGAILLLLIGIGNVANVMLVRVSGRAKEIVVRQAIGATRLNIAGTLFAESAILSVLGSVLGVALAATAIRLFGQLGAAELPLGANIGFDGRIAAGALVATILSGALLSVPVIWFSLRMTRANRLQIDFRTGTAGRSARRLRHAFIVAQISLAFVLLSGAALLGLGLKRVLEQPKGFTPEHVLTGEITLSWRRYPNQAAGTAAAERILASIQALPGVSHAALNNSMPFTGRVSGVPVSIEPGTAAVMQPMRAHHRAGVTPDYWATMNIPLVRGRLLTAADGDHTPTVCVIDQAIADRYWPGRDPIGHRLAFATTFNEREALTIVGVAGNVRQNDLGEDDDFGMVYLPFPRFSSAFFYLALRTTLPASSLAPAIRKAVLQIDPGLPIDDVQLLQTRIDHSLVPRRSAAFLTSLYAIIALLLASIGLYGVMAYSVAQRTREFGIRLALGAPQGAVLNLVLREGAWLASVGLVVGVVMAVPAIRLIGSLLSGVAGAGPGPYLAAAVVVALVGVFASLVPARRATSVDPMIALRDE